ncbi:MAG: Spy/CpxP family protein refolding chaperone [Rhodanobacteraceae bacterium]
MKKLILAIITTTLLAGAGVTLAQGHRHGHGQRGPNMERMLDSINATDAQRAQIKTIMDNNKAQAKADMKQVGETRRALRDLDPAASNYNSEVARLADELAAATRQATVDRAAIRAQVSGVLTAEQRASLEAKRAEHMQKRQERMQQFKERRAARDAG